MVQPNAEYKPIDPRLIYQYSSVQGDKPVGYVEDGFQRNLSTAPTVPTGYYTGPPSQSYASYSPIQGQSPRQSGLFE